MQPKNIPENLTPPHKGPSYCPKEKETKVIIEVLKSEEETKVKWHPYPKEKPKREGDYLLTLMIDNHRYIRFGYYDIFKKRSCFLGTNEMYIIAWAELPKPYTEEE